MEYIETKINLDAGKLILKRNQLFDFFFKFYRFCKISINVSGSKEWRFKSTQVVAVLISLLEVE